MTDAMLKLVPHNQVRMSPLLGPLLRRLPLFPLQVALQALVNVIAGRHPQLYERLPTFVGRRIGIEPNDLPFAILLEPRNGTIVVKVVRRLDREPCAVRIRAPISTLIGLTDGTYDADALFFSRDITVEGDVEAAVALRNAIDDAELDLVDEMAACLGPLAYPVSHAARLAAAALGASQAARRAL